MVYRTGIPNVIMLFLCDKSADNPSFPLRLALWSDGFFNKRTIISFNLLTI
ncbi:hypothetical protein HH172_002007 [Escherichia coli]|uniref:Uncharacterized protein n=2 Tax=Escherichia coli TaxID=562 RepID=A0A783APE3_ECOLX|nr:Class B acid phosphatase [Escherichia coli O25b:H4]EFH2468266.1 hypothetical protein [Escherichia coli]EFH2483737.1 hypothetical protein [Escherichia coli]EFI3969736.1 hypothetical protein [Escherichia coli]EFI3980978.1 hypothetical protein [Escherichia coli]